MTTDTPRTSRSKSMTTNDVCPYCGAEEPPVSNRPGGASHDGWRCGTRRFLPENIRTDLCREREAHNKTREDLEQLNIAGVTAVEAAKLFKLRAEKAEAENQKLRELLDDAICEFGKIAYWREGCHEHDDDMGHDRREFSDTEDWELLEANAIHVHRALIEKLNQLTK